MQKWILNGRRHGRSFLVQLLGLVLACLALSAHANGDDLAFITLRPGSDGIALDSNSRYWIDTSPDQSRMDVQTLRASAAMLPWFVYQSGRPHTLEARTLWLQFDALQPTRGEHWFLEIAAAGLDRATLYYRDRDGQWITQEAGDLLPVADWPLPGRYPTFDLANVHGEPVRYWLRIEQQRVSFDPQITLYPQSSLAITRDRNQFLLGAYVGLTLLMAAVAMVNAIAFRDRLFADYTIYVLALFAGQLAYTGVAAQYLWSDAQSWNAIAQHALPPLSFVVALWFMRHATTPLRFSLGLDSLVIAIIVLQTMMVVVDALWGTRHTYAAMTAFNLLILVMIGLLIGRVWQRGDDPNIRLLALGVLPVLVMALFPLARGLGLIPASILTRYGLIIGSMVQMPILLHALIRRSNHRKEASTRARALSETDPLTGLTHQRILRLRLDLALARARQHKSHCALLGVSLANHSKIVQTLGREAADRALMLAAARLRSVISDIDVASRMDEYQFALLLEGPVTAERARACATHVVAQGLRDLGVLPDGDALRFHVAVAVLPEHEMNAADSLNWVLEAASNLPLDTRKPIVMLNV